MNLETKIVENIEVGKDSLKIKEKEIVDKMKGL
jgi:hypothetical protein